MTSFKRAAQKVEKLKDDIENDTADALESSFDHVAAYLIIGLSENDSIASGRLINSIQTNRRASAEALAAQEITGASYWKYLEFGTGIYTSSDRAYESGGIPPYTPIYEWVKEKGITPDPSEPYDTQADVAAAIQHSLKTGMRQHKFVRPVWRSKHGKEHVTNEVSRAISNAVRRF